MFQRSTTDKRRVVIVDFAHLAWSYAFSQATALSCVKKVNGVPQVVDTTIPAYTIKALHRWADHGENPLAVCFDARGSARCRKAYFAKHSGEAPDGKAVGYKAKRESQDSRFYNGINLTMNLLLDGGVSCYQAEGYEADDLIKACVDKAKIDYPNLPIDIVTGDHDLIPLVDEQVSVFLRSTKSTYAESSSIEKPHYVQITPRNYQDYLEGLTAYKSLSVPYNTVLLTKLLRGDKSDEIPGKADWKPKMYKLLISLLEQHNVDVSDLFRYGCPTETVVYRGTGEEIPLDIIDTVPSDQKMIKYGEPRELTHMCDVLAPFVEPADIDHIRFVYNGINLNGAFTDLGDFNRRPAKIVTPIKGYNMVALQDSVMRFQIRLSMQ